MPDLLARWHHRNDTELDRLKTDQSFTVTREEIIKNDYDLSINRYKEVVFTYESSKSSIELAEELKNLHRKLSQCLTNAHERSL